MKKFLIAMVMLVMGTNLAFADYNPSDFPSNFVGEWIVNSPQNSVGFVGGSSLMPSDTLDATFSVWFKVDDYTKQSGLFNAYDDTSVAALGGFSCAINTSNGLYSYNRLECYIGGFSSTVKMRNWNLPVNVNDHQWHNLIVRFFQSGGTPIVQAPYLDGTLVTTTPTDIGSIGQNHYRFTDITHNDSWIVSDDPSVSVASIRFWNSVSGTLPNSDGRTYLMSLGITDPLIPVVHAAPTLQSVVDLSGSGTTSSARASVTGGVGSIVVFLVGLVAFVVFGVIIFEIIRRRRRA